MKWKAEDKYKNQDSSIKPKVLGREKEVGNEQGTCDIEEKRTYRHGPKIRKRTEHVAKEDQEKNTKDTKYSL